MFMCMQYVLNVCARTSCKTNPQSPANGGTRLAECRIKGETEIAFLLAPLPIVNLHAFRAELSH